MQHVYLCCWWCLIFCLLGIRHEEQAMNRTYNMNLEVEKHGNACQDSGETQQWLSIIQTLGD